MDFERKCSKQIIGVSNIQELKDMMMMEESERWKKWRKDDEEAKKRT